MTLTTVNDRLITEHFIWKKNDKNQIRTFIVNRFLRNVIISMISRLQVLELLTFHRNIERNVGVRQCAQTSGQCDVFDRNWRRPSSGRAASQLSSYFSLECTSSKSPSEELSFDTDVPAYPPPSFSFQHLRLSFHDVRRVFPSQCQRYCVSDRFILSIVSRILSFFVFIIALIY